MQVFTLNSLTHEEIERIIARGTAALDVEIENDAEQFLANYANGDARAALNLLENAVRLYSEKRISVEHLRETLQSKHLRYDKTGEEHYNTISAFIKSMRASDADAALYYMARMVDSGEDPKFIARRMVIFASEDIGMADSSALAVANDVFRAVESIGLPECQFNLAHGVVYLACAPKNRAAGNAYFTALDDVRELGNLPIPLHIRNAPTQLMKELGLRQGLPGIYRREHVAGRDQRKTILPTIMLIVTFGRQRQRLSHVEIECPYDHVRPAALAKRWDKITPEIQTPALDKLASQGTTFTRAYCPNPTCTPTRSSMITGKYPSQHGAYSLGTKLPESEPTVGEHFRAAGYRSALIGKAHFQPLRSTTEYPSLESYPDSAGSRLLARFRRSFLWLRPYRAGP